MGTIFGTSGRDAGAILTFGALGLFVNELQAFRVWLTGSDRSTVSTIFWAGYAVWLLVPAAWARTRVKRVSRLGSADPEALVDELLSSAAGFVIFGYGTAATAMSFVTWILRHPSG